MLLCLLHDVHELRSDEERPEARRVAEYLPKGRSGWVRRAGVRVGCLSRGVRRGELLQIDHSFKGWGVRGGPPSPCRRTRRRSPASRRTGRGPPGGVRGAAASAGRATRRRTRGGFVTQGARVRGFGGPGEPRSARRGGVGGGIEKHEGALLRGGPRVRRVHHPGRTRTRGAGNAESLVNSWTEKTQRSW